MVLREIIANEVLVITLCSWALTQIIKVFVVLIREKRFDARYFVRSGGMPSAHSAVVTALSTGIAMTQGLGSAAFSVAAIMALIVMYDAAGVRRSVSRQSVILDRMWKEIRLGHPRDKVERDLRQFIGHTPFQVIIGAAIGILVAWVWLTLSNGL